MPTTRLYIYLFLLSAWCWAGSIFTPWATSTLSRLWLYDLLFYTRYVLLFWGAFEVLFAWQKIRNNADFGRKGIFAISLIVLAMSLVFASSTAMQTGVGFRFKVKMSTQALAELRLPMFADRRQRAGWFLIDNRRQPCIDEPWLWLGEVYGGGSGNNLALVYSKNRVPKTPMVDAFRFWLISDHWWLAYQNPKNYYAHLNDTKGCMEGKRVDTHRQGLQFIRSPSLN